MAEQTRTQTEQQKQNTVERPRSGIGYDATSSHAPGASGLYADILKLSRTAGNRAVSQLLQQDVGTPAYEVDTAPSIVHDVLSSPGQPLDAATRAFMEPRFGYDFSGVRVHTDKKAAESARAVDAQAYTVGSDIVFSTGQYAPGTSRGKSLIVHELTHVAQQLGLAPTTRLTVGTASSGLEHEAGVAAAQVAHGQQVSGLSRAVGQSIQRLPVGGTQPKASLGSLDSPTTDTIMSSVMGSVSWPLLREVLRGLVEGVQNQTDERKQQIFARFLVFALDKEAQSDFNRGCIEGIGLGVWDSLKGIFDLLTLGPRLQIQAIDWLLTHGPGMVRNFDQIQAEAQELRNRLAEVGEQVSTTLQNFMRNPREGMKALRAMLDQFVEGAQEKAREAGHAIAESIFEFLELPWQQFGEKIGHVVGMAVFEVLLAVATEGIGTVLKAIGSAFRGGRVLVAEALRLFRWLGEITGRLREVLRALGKSALKIFEGIGESLGRLFEQVQALVRRVLAGMETAAEAALPERAVAGGGKLPPNVLMSEARGGGRLPARTTVEELRPRSTSEAIDELEETLRGSRTTDPSERRYMAEAGRQIQPSAIAAWSRRLGRDWQVLTRKEWPSWIKRRFPSGGPDMVAINRVERRIIVGDVAPSSASRVDVRPGMGRGAPKAARTAEEQALVRAGDEGTMMHLEKTRDDALRVAEGLPQTMRNFEVFFQEYYWEAGKQLSRLIRVYP